MVPFFRRLFNLSGRFFKYGVLLFVILTSLSPFVWVFLSTFKTNKEILDSALSWPSHFSFVAYANALARARFPLYFFNSMFVSGLSTLGAVSIFGMAAYVLARYEFRGRDTIYAILISSLLLSLIPMQQPIAIIIRMLHLYDTRWALILVYAAKGLPIVIFIMWSFFKSLPKEIEEAAYLDGANFWQTYTRVMLPMSKPAVASAAVLIFLNSWNEFLFALLLTQSESKRTLSYALRFFVDMFAYDYPTLFAAMFMTILPSILIYIVLQEQIHKSLVGGAVKG